MLVRADKGADKRGQARMALDHCRTRDITANVIEALRRDSQRKLALLEQHGNQRLMSVFRQFAAIEGSGVYEGFISRSAVYVRYLLQKNNAA